MAGTKTKHVFDVHFCFMGVLMIGCLHTTLANNNNASNSCPPLMLTPYLDQNLTGKARELSKVQGLECYVPQSYTGLITVNKTLGNHLFFWYFPSPTNSSAPLLLWLNGGPGYSSMQGLFWQHGPLKIKDGGYTYREETLVGPFSMLYVDQPVGVGFSFSDSGTSGYRTTGHGSGQDMAEFMAQFVTMFPQYETLDVYLGGQSYAGKYIPHMVDNVESAIKNKNLKMNLKGIYLGGPFIDAETLFVHAADYAYAMGVISKKQLDDFRKKQTDVVNQFKNGTLPKETSSDIFDSCYPFELAGSLYNYATQDKSDFENEISSVMKSDKMRRALHVGDRDFIPTSGVVNEAFTDDLRRSTKDLLGNIMEKYKVLIYNGDFDYIVSSPALEATLLSTPWNGQKSYHEAERSPWKYNGKILGYYSQTDKFCRVVIYGTGHQSGRYKPRALRYMLEQFVQHGCVQSNCQ